LITHGRVVFFGPAVFVVDHVRAVLLLDTMMLDALFVPGWKTTTPPAQP